MGLFDWFSGINSEALSTLTVEEQKIFKKFIKEWPVSAGSLRPLKKKFSKNPRLFFDLWELSYQLRKIIDEHRARSAIFGGETHEIIKAFGEKIDQQYGWHGMMFVRYLVVADYGEQTGQGIDICWNGVGAWRFDMQLGVMPPIT